MIRAFEPDIDGKRIIVKSVVASALLLNVLSGLILHRCRILLNYRYGLVLIWILVVGAERERERERVGNDDRKAYGATASVLRDQTSGSLSDLLL